MKAGFFALSSLLTLAAAQPAARHAAHQQFHDKRDVVVMETDIVTATAPTVVVYVDQYGNTISAPASSTPAPVVNVAAVAEAKPTAAAVAPKVEVSSSSASVNTASSSKNSASGSTSGSASASGLGIVYSPYNNDGSCKTANEVMSDFEKIEGYSMVRIYATDCQQVTNVIAASKPKGMKIFAGVYDISDVASEISLLVQGFSSNWVNVDTVSIGNELVNSGKASAAQVVAAVNIARPILRAAGFTGPVVTVDTFNAVIANPELCEASDYAAVNAHPFFDATATAQSAGEWAKNTMANVQAACGGKKTVITECGWPSAGSANGAAVPSPENQEAAISSIKSAFSSNMIVFSAFNDMWKQNSAATFGTEQFWGIFGMSTQ